MKLFRKIWLGFVVLIIILFVGYRVIEFVKTDSSGPVISGGEDVLTISIQDGEEVLLAGMTALDQKDGDVTDSLIVEKISNFYGDGTRIVTYAAFDSDNHISKTERKISYRDYESPKLELTGSLRFRAGETPNIDKIVKAYDSLDGDLSNKVKIHMDTALNTRITGFYNVIYEVSNSAGDTVKLPIEVEFYEPYNHEVELNLDRYLVYYEGTALTYRDYIKSVRRGNTEYDYSEIADLCNVTVDSQVDTAQPGVYPVYYYFTQQIGNVTYEAKEILYVVVE